MRAIGYFRESPADGETLAEQHKAFLAFCEREGYEVAATYVDIVADTGHTPGFRQLIAELRRRDKSLVVVVPSVLALGSDVREAAARYFQLEGLGAQIALLSGTHDVADELVMAWTAQESGGRLSERVRAAMRRKAVKGEVLGRPPYGYKVGSRRRLELVPEEAVVVRYIYRLYLQEGMGIRLIARRLNEEGLKTRRGGNWSMVSIRDILRNRAYLGTYLRFGVRVPGSHPPLVSADDFRVVQDRLNARRTSYAPRVASQFLLSGIARCGYCGNKLIGVSRKQAWKRASGEQVSNSYRYYQCESRTNQSLCSYHTRRADELESLVRTALEDSLAEVDTRPTPGDEDGAATLRRQDADRLRARLKSIDRRLEGYMEGAAKGRITKDKMRALSLKASAERLAAEDALEIAEMHLNEHLTEGDSVRARRLSIEVLLGAWDNLPFDEKQAAVREIITRLTVRDDALELTLRR